MFTTTLVTLAAAAALNAHPVPANTQTAAKTGSTPAVTAISVPARPSGPRGAHIPGTFTVSADQDPLEGLHALVPARSGDGGG